MFTGKNVKSYMPQSKLDGQWLICNPENVPGFSAVGYLFARDLQKELNVPVGMITVAYGASAVEAWVSRQKLAGDPLLRPMLDNFDAMMDYYRTDSTAPADKGPVPPTPINKRRTPGGRQQRPGRPISMEPTVPTLQRDDRSDHSLRHEGRHLVSGGYQSPAATPGFHFTRIFRMPWSKIGVAPLGRG